MNTGQYTDQLLAIDLEDVSWQEIKALQPEGEDFKLMGAQMVPFYYRERDTLDLFSKSDIRWN